MSAEILNARIRRTDLGPEDHGIFTAMIHVEAEGWGQGFGGYGLKGPYAYEFINGVLSTLRVDRWEDLVGKYCRVERLGGLLSRIGHITDDRWFDPVETFHDMKKSAK